MSSLSRVLRPRTLGTLHSISPKFVAMYSNSADVPKFETLAVSVPKPFVYHVQLNRPDKLNALNRKMWLEVGECFQQLGENADCRAIVLSAAGRLFTAGIDLKDFAKMGPQLAEIEDVARRCKMLEKNIQLYQDSISSLEKVLTNTAASSGDSTKMTKPNNFDGIPFRILEYYRQDT